MKKEIEEQLDLGYHRFLHSRWGGMLLVAGIIISTAIAIGLITARWWYVAQDHSETTQAVFEIVRSVRLVVLVSIFVFTLVYLERRQRRIRSSDNGSPR